MKAIQYLYDEINMNIDSVVDDWNNNYLTINECRNKRLVVWYIDECHNCCIYIDTLDELDEEEIGEQLC